MIKITDSGELEVYPKGAGLPLLQQLRWLFVFPVLGLLAYGCHVLFGSSVALVVVMIAGFACVIWWRFQNKHAIQTICSGMYLVSAGCVHHMAGRKILDTFSHNGRDATVKEQGQQITLTLLDEKKKPVVIFTGFENRKEADAMLACLSGRKIGKRNANIRMQA